MVQERPVRVERRLSAILAADVAGYSRLMHNDEEATHAKLTALLSDAVAPAIAEHGGRIVKNTGDGFLAEFPSAVEAVRAATQFQTRINDLTIRDEDKRITFRVGINIGDVIVEPHDIFGDGVNIAARLESIAEPGGICISSSAYDHVRGKVGVEFADMGEQNLKNIALPVRAYAVVRDGLGSATKGGSTTPSPLSAPDAASGAPGDKPSVAVLPFANLSGDKEQDYFSDGITEDIITELSRFSELLVIARNSSFMFKGKAVNVRQVGRELGVRYLLEGSIRRDGERVRITAQLIDVLTGGHLWAERYDRELKDIFAVQEEVACAIVAVLADHVYVAEIELAKRTPTENLGAYDLYLRGMAEVYKWTREANEEALRLFYRAIELDPEFPPPYGAAVMHFSTRRASGWTVDRDQEVAEVRRLARRVMQLCKRDATAFSQVGHTLSYVANDLLDGVALIDEALALNPNLGSSWAYSGWSRLWLGETDLAIEHFGRAMRLSPVDPAKFWPQEGTAHAHFFAGRYDEALAWARTALRSRPDSHAALRIGAASGALAGRYDEARRLAARLHEIDPALRASTLSTVLGPYRNLEHVAKYADGLRKAGPPD